MMHFYNFTFLLQVMRMNVTGNPEVRLYYLKDSIMTNVKDCIEAELNHPQ